MEPDHADDAQDQTRRPSRRRAQGGIGMSRVTVKIWVDDRLPGVQYSVEMCGQGFGGSNMTRRQALRALRRRIVKLGYNMTTLKVVSRDHGVTTYRGDLK